MRMLIAVLFVLGCGDNAEKREAEEAALEQAREEAEENIKRGLREAAREAEQEAENARYRIEAEQKREEEKA